MSPEEVPLYFGLANMGVAVSAVAIGLTTGDEE